MSTALRFGLSRTLEMRPSTVALCVGVLIALLSGCGPVNTVATPTDDAAETVVLLHGLGRSPRAMSRLAVRLEEAGYRVESLGYSSIGESPETIVQGLKEQIAACCLDRSGPLHFVGHSLGGLLIRGYIEAARPSNLGRVVMLGTPNRGTAVVDRYRNKWWFSMLGSTAMSLGTDAASYPNTLPAPDYPVGVIAGRKPQSNDALLPGDDDGLVAVDSTKVAGMSDFLVVDVGHAAMRYDARVAARTIEFLRTGRFRAGAGGT